MNPDFGALVLAHVDTIRRIGWSRLRRRDELDDFTQDVIPRLYANRERLRDRERFPQWAAAIARNTSSKWNHKGVPLPVGDPPDRPVGDPDSYERLEGAERARAVLAALGSLEERDRAILVAHYMDDTTYAELEREYGLSRSAVAMRLQRARQRLRGRLRHAVVGLTTLLAPRRERAFGAPPMHSSTLTRVIFVGVGAACIAGTSLTAPGSSTEPNDATREARVDLALGRPGGKDSRMSSSQDRLSLARIRRENGSVVIDGVPSLSFMQTFCTYVGALEAAMAVTAHPYGYTDLMGVSGLAFRLRWYDAPEQKWCPSSAVGEGAAEAAAIAKATGWQSRAILFEDWENPNVGRYADQITAAVDAGLPVVTYDDGLNCATIYGYENGGDKLHIRTYFDKAAPVARDISKVGPMLEFLEDYTEPMRPREAIEASLRIAVDHWAAERGAWSVDRYLYGQAAYDRWFAHLDSMSEMPPDELDGFRDVSLWNYGSLVDARREAAAYLLRAADGLTGEARAAVTRAGGIYRAEHDLLHEAGNLEGDLMPRLRAVLEQAAEMEASAVSELERAVALLDG
ncbi:sigma-70 family RNA polymerase sigma factor [Candidatus Poribacteria bacterium]|nr:sigma-70 family RNA polymerase sigma factor [Candidatus Poribacteria bacterium]